MRFNDQVAVITGAARGLGAAFAVAFAKEGVRVVIADIGDGAETVQAIEAAGGQALYVKTDVRDQRQCAALMKAAAERFGQIDVLINDAAILSSIVHGPFTEVTSAAFQQILDVNVVGSFHCIQAVFPYLRERGGSIVNMASASVLEGATGLPHYVASKGAVMAMTRSLARELGEFGIRVNSIAPGFTNYGSREQFAAGSGAPLSLVDAMQIPMRCLKRAGCSEELAGLALFLASQESSFITGQMIVHDGGISLY